MRRRAHLGRDCEALLRWMQSAEGDDREEDQENDWDAPRSPLLVGVALKLLARQLPADQPGELLQFLVSLRRVCREV